MRRLHLLAVATLSFVACDQCSARQEHDLQTESEIDAVLTKQFAPSYDAGVLALAALELELAPTLEITPARLAELADASVDDVRITEGRFSMQVVVHDRAAARALVPTLLDRGVPVFTAIERDGGVELDVELIDPSNLAPDVYPPWLPETGGVCWSSCRERAERITAKRALLTELQSKLERLRQLRRIKAQRDEFQKRAASPELRALVDLALAAQLRADTRLSFHSEVARPAKLQVCYSGLDLDACGKLFPGAKCAVAEQCRVQRCTDAPSCGFVVYP